MEDVQILVGDCQKVLKQFPAESFRCCITSPPYFGLRNYHADGQLGLEDTIDAYVNHLVAVFRQVWRVLAADGTLWLNIADSYVNNPGNGRGGETRQEGGTPHRSGRDKTHLGLPVKNLIGIPWRTALALQSDGWLLRSDIIWHKVNVLPESVKDRPTKAHEYIFLLAKQPNYYYDYEAIKEPAVSKKGASRNKRSVWTIPTAHYKGAHFAVYPTTLVESCLLAGSAEDDTVLDPFVGSGTTGIVALQHKRKFVGIEINPTYAEMARQRIAAER